MNTPLNIIQLIEKNPLTRLSKNYQSVFINKIKEKFTESQQQLFVASFYCYLNYNSKTDFVIDLDNIWKWLGFARKDPCKRLLEKYFTKEIDYKILLHQVVEQKIEDENRGGHNKEQILLNIVTFKKLCLKAGTKKADEIHDYFVKLEEIQQEVMEEESNELKNQLQEKDKLIEQINTKVKNLENPDNRMFFYIGHNSIIKNLYKIGIAQSYRILKRKEEHGTSNPNFEFIFTYESVNAKLIESFIILILKQYKNNKPEWFNIEYDILKQLVDFTVMMYDGYKIEDNIQNLRKFMTRYRSNTLKHENKARIIIDKKIYEKYIKENIVCGPNLKVPREQILQNFYDWYKNNGTENKGIGYMKTKIDGWSKDFSNEFKKNITELTKSTYHKKICIMNREKGYSQRSNAGFTGIDIKNEFENKYFKENVYTDYIKEKLQITNNNSHKLSRVEILNNFISWTVIKQFKSKIDIYGKNDLSKLFKNFFIEKIEELTKIKFEHDLCKGQHKGIFVGLKHNDIDCDNKIPKKKYSIEEKINNCLNKWKIEDTDVAKIYRKIVLNNNLLTITEAGKINSNDITYEKKYTVNHLIFGKDNKNVFILQDIFKKISENDIKEIKLKENIN